MKLTKESNNLLVTVHGGDEHYSACHFAIIVIDTQLRKEIRAHSFKSKAHLKERLKQI